MTESFDVLIVGGGSAGAVLANRLSADQTRRVLLLEAGSAYAPNLYPADLANADIVGGPDGHDWGYVGAMGSGGRSLKAPRGKVLGGSSAVNAGVAIRARAADFAKWSAIASSARSIPHFASCFPTRSFLLTTWPERWWMWPCVALEKAERRFSRTMTSAISPDWFLPSLKSDRAPVSTAGRRC